MKECCVKNYKEVIQVSSNNITSTIDDFIGVEATITNHLPYILYYVSWFDLTTISNHTQIIWNHNQIKNQIIRNYENKYYQLFSNLSFLPLKSLSMYRIIAMFLVMSRVVRWVDTSTLRFTSSLIVICITESCKQLALISSKIRNGPIGLCPFG